MNDVAMSNAVNSCKLFSSDFVRRWKYEQEEIAKRTQISALNYEKREGREEGIEEGREQGREETILKNAVAFMKNGAPLDLIIKSLGLTKEKLLELAKENNITIKE